MLFECNFIKNKRVRFCIFQNESMVFGRRFRVQRRIAKSHHHRGGDNGDSINPIIGQHGDCAATRKARFLKDTHISRNEISNRTLSERLEFVGKRRAIAKAIDGANKQRAERWKLICPLARHLPLPDLFLHARGRFVSHPERALERRQRFREE